MLFKKKFKKLKIPKVVIRSRKSKGRQNNGETKKALFFVRVLEREHPPPPKKNQSTASTILGIWCDHLEYGNENSVPKFYRKNNVPRCIERWTKSSMGHCSFQREILV